MIVHTKRAIYHNPTGGEKKGYSLTWAELGAGINKRSQEKTCRSNPPASFYLDTQ
jgi:hypothetical protein